MIIAAIMLVLLVLFIAFGISDRVEITHYTIESQRLPSAFDGMKIVQISDYHNSDFGDSQKAFIQSIAAQAPDMIFLTGDIVDKRNTNTQATYEMLQGISQIAPCYFVTGNHETAEVSAQSYAQLKVWMEELQITDLDDSTVTFAVGGESIQIHGQRYRSKYVADFLSPADRGRFNVFLYHGADSFDLIAPFGYDLVFAGHTHGGLVRLPVVGGILGNDMKFFPKYDGGIFVSGDSTMVCSRGIGGSAPRLYNNPEIVVVTLKVQD